MIFYLDISGEELSSIDASTLTMVTGDLLRARRLGHHLVIISRRSANWIRQNIDMNNRERAMLDRTEQEYSQTAGLRNLARVYVALSVHAALNLTVNGNAITISLSDMAHYRLLDQSVLLIEDLSSDGALYAFLLHCHCNLHGCSHVSYDLRHGGGENIAKVFSHEISENRIVCGIVDSDRNSPLTGNAKLGALVAIASKHGWPLGFAISPPCREAENIVPFPLITTLPSGNRNTSNIILSRINRSEGSGGHAIQDSYLLFFDLKEGLITEKFAKYPSEEQAWIEAKLRLGGVTPTTQNLAGYGDKIVNQILQENRFMSELKRLTHQNSWRNLFAPFVDDLVWPFAASLKVIT